MALIDEIREWMEAEGLTQVEAARLLGYSQPYLCQLLRGREIKPRTADAIRHRLSQLQKGRKRRRK